MKNTLETRLGMFVLLAMIATYFILQILGAGNFLQRGYHARAQFNNVQDLKPGDAVKMAGVPIGRVEKIRLVNNRVEVTLKLNKDKDAMVRTDTKATIKFTGLMGQYHVSLDFGGPNSPQLADGGMLETVEQPDLSTIMAKLDDVATGVQNLTKSFSGEKIDNILGPLVSFMKDNNPRFNVIFANLQAISTQIAEGRGTVGKLISDDTVYTSAQNTLSNAQAAVMEIKAAVAQARVVLDEAASGKGTIGKLLNEDTLAVELTATMKNLHEITGKMNSGQGTVGELINNKDFLNNAKLSLQKLDKATESLEDTGPLSILGQIVTTLF